MRKYLLHILIISLLKEVIMLNYVTSFLRYKNTYALCVSLFLLFIVISGCSSNNVTREEDVEAISGIAFLIIESNYGYPENKDVIKEGVEYSRYWLSKQTPMKKKKLEELSYILSSLIINLHIESLERMTNQSENIEGKLDDEKRSELEDLINKEEGFAAEWQKHKSEFNKEMLKIIGEFREKLETAEQKEQIILMNREVYTQSQSIMRRGMEARIREMF